MDCKVLVLGAGGLGCEVLKNLVMMKVKEIHVIDMDTIELTNLNRQFLFRDEDIGKPKAQVAANYINNWNQRNSKESHGDATGVLVVPYVQDLTLLPPEFFKKFQFVISGLDAIEPRRFANQVLVQITKSSNFEHCIPFIDGGTEGFKGHIKTIIPGISACWECSIDTLPSQQQTHPMCTIANNPRTLEHVLAYVISVQLPEARLDDPNDIQKLLRLSIERAEHFKIDTEELTIPYLLGVIKNIIPSVSSTNAIIAAACCNELAKIYYDLVDFDRMPNFTTYSGVDGCYMHSFRYERRSDCSVCSGL